MVFGEVNTHGQCDEHLYTIQEWGMNAVILEPRAWTGGGDFKLIYW